MLESINQIQFFNSIESVRKDHNKTASEVASFLGISRMQYYRYEKDLTPVPAKVIFALAKWYCVPVISFMFAHDTTLE